MTDTQAELSVDDYMAVLRSDFASFAERVFHELHPGEPIAWNWHLDVLASKLNDAAQGKIKRLIITLPPRQLKSILISVALPAWLLGRRPNAKVLCASYVQDLADDLARKCLTVMNSAWYQRAFATRLEPNRRAAYDFQTTRRGFRRATSAGGALTGFGADTIIVDDPQKPADMASQAQRRVANTWFSETLLSRLNNKTEGCIIVVMQRLHVDDLVGHLTTNGEWHVVNFPAIAETDELHRFSNAFGSGEHVWRKGEALHPERESLDALEALRRDMGTYAFSAQYLQRPQPREGAGIDANWFRRFDINAPPKFEEIIQSWDTANKGGEQNDYSVCTTWGVRGKEAWLLHVHRAKHFYPALKRAVRELDETWNPKTIIVEDHASGEMLVQDLHDDGFYKIKAFKPKGDKFQRMENRTGMIEFGRVFLPDQAGWLQDYLDEMLAFPNPATWDQIDSTSQALEWIATQAREPHFIAFARQEMEKAKALWSPGYVRLRAPGLGRDLHLSGGAGPIRADADGIYHCPSHLLDNLGLAGLLNTGWTRVDPPPSPPPPRPWVLQAPPDWPLQHYDGGNFVGPDDRGLIRTTQAHAEMLRAMHPRLRRIE